jgi:hypothetical protein
MNNYWLKAQGKAAIVDRMPRGSRALNPDYYDLPDDAVVPMFLSPDAISIAVAGTVSLMWGGGRIGGVPQVYSIDEWR